MDWNAFTSHVSIGLFRQYALPPTSNRTQVSQNISIRLRKVCRCNLHTSRSIIIVQPHSCKLSDNSVNLATWFILYPFWRHATLQSLLSLPYWEFFPPRKAFHPLHHNYYTFFLSFFYHFGTWLVQINVHKNFKQIFYPPIENAVYDHEGTYPSSLTGLVSDAIPMVLGLGIETMLLRSLARDFGPSGLVLNAVEIGSLGLMVKAFGAEWTAEWAWLEVQYWVNEWWYWIKGYNE